VELAAIGKKVEYLNAYNKARLFMYLAVDDLFADAQRYAFCAA